MKNILLTFTSTILAMSIVAGPAAAQPLLTPRLTVEDVLPTNPFPGIDIAAAGNTTEAIKAWGDVLSDTQRVEITDRCGIIEANQATYQVDATAFCTAFVETYPSLTPSQDGGAALGVPAGVPMAPMVTPPVVR